MNESFSGTEIIDIAKEIERYGERYYNAVKDRVKDPAAKEVFAFLALEEARHYNVFEEILGSLGLERLDWRANEEYVAYLRTLCDCRVFPAADEAVSAAQNVKKDADAIKCALEFEQASIRFLYELRKLAVDDAKSIVDELIAEEHRHVEMLTELAIRRSKRS